MCAGRPSCVVLLELPTFRRGRSCIRNLPSGVKLEDLVVLVGVLPGEPEVAFRIDVDPVLASSPLHLGIGRRPAAQVVAPPRRTRPPAAPTCSSGASPGRREFLAFHSSAKQRRRAVDDPDMPVPLVDGDARDLAEDQSCTPFSSGSGRGQAGSTRKLGAWAFRGYGGLRTTPDASGVGPGSEPQQGLHRPWRVFGAAMP